MEEKRCYGCMKIKSGESVCEHCGYDETVKNEMHQIPAGTVLKEQYLIGKVLGQGGFGITYLGWDMYLDVPVAIKEYFPSGSVMRETSVSMDVVSYSGDIGVRFRNNKERFMREAKMLARFSQVPEIVQIKNFFLANNTAYIVMEYVEGITLKEYVKSHGGKLSVEETFILMEPVIQALCKVHKSGLVHRDISPDNIMMLPEGKVKLLDFGAVRDVGDADVDKPLTKSTEAILKQGYAPIEQYQNRGSLGPWTDVYALCATIYYCLTGEVPPDAPERLLGDDELDFRGLVPELSEKQEEVLKAGMELRAQERIASMDELYQRLYKDDVEDIGETEISKTVIDTKGRKKNASKKETEDKEYRADKKVSIVAGLMIVFLTLAGTVFVLLENEMAENASTGVEATDENVLEGQCGEDAYWSFDRENGVLTLSGEGCVWDFNAPGSDDNSDDYDPNIPYVPWADYMEEITMVIMENEITQIGSNAFIGARDLTEIQWSNQLQTIGFKAFAATGIEGLQLPYTIEGIAGFAFADCENLKNVDLPYRLADLQAGTFWMCNELESVVIRPYTVICYDAFSDIMAYTPFSTIKDGEHAIIEGLTIHTYESSNADPGAKEFAEDYDVYYELIHDGRCGDGVNWTFESDSNTLYLHGEGDTWIYSVGGEELEDWRSMYPYPWVFCEMPDWFYTFEQDIEHVVVSDGITRLNATLLGKLPNLKTVELADSVEGLDYTFVESDNIEEVYCGPNTEVDNDIFTMDENGVINDKLVLYVYEGSPMQNYAEERGIAYEIIE